MRRAVLAAATGVLLAGPAVLAFFDGGFPERPRLLAGAAAWALVLIAALLAERPLPRTAAGRTALGGLALLTAWTGLSMLWAPLLGAAGDDLQRLLLYLAVFAAAIALLRDPRARRAVEPVLAAGILAAAAYGLSERVLPSVVELDFSPRAGGRLNQPLGYWNAMGALAAMGIVLSARLAGDGSRPPWLRAAAAAAAAPLGAAAYLTFSRGAIAALAIGVLALAVLAPGRAQLRALAVTLAAGTAAAAAAGALPAVRKLDGDAGEGAAMLAVLVVLALAAGALTWRFSTAEAAARLAVGPVRLPRLAPAVAAVVVVAASAALVAVAGSDPGPRRAAAADPGRLGSFESSRYEYWGVALDGFASDPLVGLGAGGFRVEWLKSRDIPEAVRDAHSLYLETPAELGLVGLALLALFVGGVAAAAVRARRLDRAAAAGPIAALAVWAAHAGVDWDWEMPALTLVALVLAGSLVAAADDL